MSTPLKKIQPVELFTNSEFLQSPVKKIRETHTPELIFVLCGYMGTDIHSVGESLKYLVENEYGYSCEIIHLSKLIEKNKITEDLNFDNNYSKEYIRIKNLIHHGNKLREKYGNSILAELAISKIGIERFKEAEKIKSNPNEELLFEPRRKCFIVDSIKNPSELNIIKEVYRNLVYFMGVFSPYRIREENLKMKEIKSKEIADLIDQDSHEDIPHGQGVRDIFMQADYFIRLDSAAKSHLEIKLKRFLHLIFGTDVITPTKDETAMYFAASAAVNSACLSRQVGASITDKNGNIISIGWNDVPCFGGNLYKQNDSDLIGKNDYRCINFQAGKCLNDFYKSRISKKLLERLIEKETVNYDKSEDALKIIKSSELKQLIEFSRAIHAEMHAIIIGSQKSGDKMIGGKLYCTTYPCHNCARHIVLAGISEVYYIEPYTKSLATTLHSDSLTDDENERNKVRLLLYDGVAPSKYMQLFKMSESARKDSEGNLFKPSLNLSTPKFTETLEALFTLESAATRKLKNNDWKL